MVPGSLSTGAGAAATLSGLGVSTQRLGQTGGKTLQLWSFFAGFFAEAKRCPIYDTHCIHVDANATEAKATTGQPLSFEPRKRLRRVIALLFVPITTSTSYGISYPHTDRDQRWCFKQCRSYLS